MITSAALNAVPAAALGTDTTGAPITVTAYGHVLIHGRDGSGKLHAIRRLAAQWRPHADVIEISPARRGYAWQVERGGQSTPATTVQVMRLLIDLAEGVRLAGVATAWELPAGPGSCIVSGPAVSVGRVETEAA